MTLYDKMINNLFKNTLNSNYNIRKEVLTLYKRLIEDSSKYEKDLKLFPALIDSLMHDEEPVNTSKT